LSYPKNYFRQLQTGCHIQPPVTALLKLAGWLNLNSKSRAELSGIAISSCSAAKYAAAAETLRFQEAKSLAAS
jgi:hypothetical protein